MYTNIIDRLASDADPAQLVTQDRAVKPFDHILVRGYGDLQIVQGPAPALTVTTHKSLIDRIESRIKDGRLTLGFGSWWDKLTQAFTTSLTRQPIIYRLTVPTLAGLETQGMVKVRSQGLTGEELFLRVRGIADIHLSGLQVETLEVHMAPGGRVLIDGEVDEQRLAIKGPGAYVAGELASQKASINIQGPGQAAVNVRQQLSVTIYGPGYVTYTGTPSVQKRLHGPAVLRQTGHFQQATE